MQCKTPLSLAAIQPRSLARHLAGCVSKRTSCRQQHSCPTLHKCKTAAINEQQGKPELSPQEIQDRALTREIATAASLDDLLDILGNNIDTLNHYQTIAAFHRLGKHANPADKQYIGQHTLTRQLNEQLINASKPIEEWDSVALANVLWSHAQLGHGFEALLRKVATELDNPDRTYSATTYMNTLYPCAKLHIHSTGLLEYFPTFVAGIDEDTSVRTLCLVAWSIVQLETIQTTTASPPTTTTTTTDLDCNICRLLDIIASRLLNPASSEALKVSIMSLTMLASATADAQHIPNETAAMILDAISTSLYIKNANTRPEHRRPLSARDISALFHGIARLVTLIAQQQLQQLGRQIPPHHVVWRRTVAEILRANPHRQQTAKYLVNEVQYEARDMNMQSLMMSAWACAMLQVRFPGVLLPLEKRTLQLIQQDKMDAQALSTICWSFGALHHDSERLTEAISRAVVDYISKTEGQNGGTTTTSLPPLNDQAVAMLAYSLAVLDRCSGPNASKLLPLLAMRATELMGAFWGHGLCNLAWGFAVAEFYPVEFFTLWRSKIPSIADAVSGNGLAQLHQIEVALRLEAPHIGATTPTDAVEFFDAMYKSGRTKTAARDEWGAAMQTFKMSNYQLQVYTTVQKMGIECELEYFDPGQEYSIDIAVPSHRVAIEADGPTHFATNTLRPLGSTAFKRRLLNKMGWKVVSVPYFEWNGVNNAQGRMQFIEKKLAELGILLSDVVASSKPVESTAAADSGTEQHGVQGLEHADVALVVDQQQNEEETAEAVRLQEEEQPTSKSGNDGDDEKEQADVVADRAQRLEALKYTHGSLGKSALVSRAIERKRRGIERKK